MARLLSLDQEAQDWWNKTKNDPKTEEAFKDPEVDPEVFVKEMDRIENEAKEIFEETSSYHEKVMDRKTHEAIQTSGSTFKEVIDSIAKRKTHDWWELVLRATDIVTLTHESSCLIQHSNMSLAVGETGAALAVGGTAQVKVQGSRIEDVCSSVCMAGAAQVSLEGCEISKVLVSFFSVEDQDLKSKRLSVRGSRLARMEETTLWKHTDRQIPVEMDGNEVVFESSPYDGLIADRETADNVTAKMEDDNKVELTAWLDSMNVVDSSTGIEGLGVGRRICFASDQNSVF